MPFSEGRCYMLQRLFVLTVTILATGASYSDDFFPKRRGGAGNSDSSVSGKSWGPSRP
jgi:hypothetical protein